MKNKTILFLIFVIAFLIIMLPVILGKSFIGRSENMGGGYTLILTGFGSQDDKGNWFGETAPFLKKTENIKDVGYGLAACQNAYEGNLYGNKVLVVSSGMAKVKTTACLHSILQVYEGKINEVIFVGIAGFTPAKGGLFDEYGNRRESGQVMLGDVCVSSSAFDFDLQHYSSDQAGVMTANPVFWPQDGSFESQLAQSDSVLAQEIFDASIKVDWPEAPESIKNVNVTYHGFLRFPKVWKMNECIEATGDLYWHDIRTDAKARELAANYLSQIYNNKIEAKDVLIASSMEASAVASTIKWWNESKTDNISFAYVRSASNFDHPFVNVNGTPALGGQSSVRYLSESGGAIYAIETAALPVLKMFELR